MSYFLELERRRLGVLSSLAHERLIWRDRFQRLRLSERREFSASASGGIVTMELDAAEHRYLITGETSGYIRIYDTVSATSAPPPQPSASGVPLVAGFSPLILPPVGEVLNTRISTPVGAALSSVIWYPFDSGLFMAAGADKSIKVYDTNSLVVASSFQINSALHQIAMSSIATRHSLIAAGTGANNIRLCDLHTGAFSHTLVGHKGEVLTVAWAPHSEFQLVSGSSDQTIRVWDIRRAGALMILDSSNLYGASINEKFVSPRDQIVRRDVTSHNGSVSHVLYSSDGLNVYSLGLDNCLRCWDSKTGKHSFRHFPNIASTMRNTRFAIARDEFLFVPSGLQLNQYSTASGGFLHKFNGHFDRICAVAVNPSAGEVYSAGMDRAILVWAEEKGQEIDEKEEKIEKADPAQLSPSLGAANGPLEMSIIHPSLSAQMSRTAHMEDGDNWSDDER